MLAFLLTKFFKGNIKTKYQCVNSLVNKYAPMDLIHIHFLAPKHCVLLE